MSVLQTSKCEALLAHPRIHIVCTLHKTLCDHARSLFHSPRPCAKSYEIQRPPQFRSSVRRLCGRQIGGTHDERQYAGAADGNGGTGGKEEADHSTTGMAEDSNTREQQLQEDQKRSARTRSTYRWVEILQGRNWQLTNKSDQYARKPNVPTFQTAGGDPTSLPPLQR